MDSVIMGLVSGHDRKLDVRALHGPVKRMDKADTKDHVA